ncbi:flagellar biosynthesis sigma factor [Pandoraea terrae]|uniref:flagellar biosynthesis sigma factor n=1 Tax=Pandoraea terrae TaxID=1537710 RepID=UPI001CD55548|nr:flagellar biosynthesis sigma factor [Pandoraea terrae]
MLGVAVIAILALAAVRLIGHIQSDVPEIALVIGEPWEAMRQRSSAKIDPAIPGHVWGRIPKIDARLRFIDPTYGFVTPPARFFSVGFDDERVNNVRMSPQIEPLLLDDALKIVLDLEEQWRKGGWQLTFPEGWPAFADTPQWRAQIQACRASTTYWQAESKYQALLTVACFQDDRHPNEERYLITLALAKPWLK